jgi:hypothetical protein
MYSSCLLGCENSCEVTQSSAQQSAAQTNQEASSASAATGVIYAAEGANNLDDNPATAGTLIEAGQEAITTAVSLKEFELKNRALVGQLQTPGVSLDNQDANAALIADPKILSSTIADGIFTTLEGKYGISRDDFIEKTLQSRGDQSTLQDLLKGKVSAEKFSKAFSSASELTKDERKSIVQSAEAAGIKTKQEETYEIMAGNPRPRAKSIRESLRKKLDALKEKETEETEEEPEISQTSEPQSEMEGVTALSSEEFFGGREPAAEELSIFDAVHRKYRERSRMMETERGMILSPLPKE